MLHAVIMAGGSGTRFWPASRKERPKQLLPLVGDHSMIRQTVDRLGSLVPEDRVLIVTNERLVDAVQQELPSLPTTSIVGEPAKRDTAPCIGLAALLVSKNDPDAIMAVLPSDHVISPSERFQQALEQAAQLVEETPGRIVTFGIVPSYAAESFGYIERGDSIEANDSGAAPMFHVKQFREKPDAATAEEYLRQGSFYWNSGIFVWRAQTILDELSKRQPGMMEHLRKIDQAWGTAKHQEVLDRDFKAIEGISIDFAVMEHATDVAVIEAPYEWDDLGSWRSLARLRGVDQNKNTLIGRCLAIDTKDTIVRSDGEHLVATIGLEGCVVVHTDHATLIARKEDEERVREVVAELNDRDWQDVL